MTQAEKAKAALDAANSKKAADAAAEAAKKTNTKNSTKEAEEKAAAEAAAEAAKLAEKAKQDSKSEEPEADADGFLNPFLKGVTYESFLKAKGNKTTENYCKGKIEKHEIAWLVVELKNYEANKKNN